MNILKKLLSVPASTRTDFHSFAVKCNRCGEVIAGRLNLNNDLSLDYEDGRNVYFSRKVLIGSGHCFQRIEVFMKFNPAHKLLERQASGGEFVD
jgi:hypothetical protein